MRRRLSSRQISLAALVAGLVALLAPLPAALAGGCCFTQITIQSLDTGRQVTLSGPALTSPYDLSTFFSFADFTQPAAQPSRSGPAYEVARDGWDHLIYYPGTANQPGVVYYEGLFNGSSEYDGRWFLVPAQQDAALRAALARQGFPPMAAWWPLPWPAWAGLAAAVLLSLGSLWFFPHSGWRPRRHATNVS